MPSGKLILLPGLLALFVLAMPACLHRSVNDTTPSLGLEQHSLRIPLTTDTQGMAHWQEHPPMVGTIDMKPIFAAEGIPAGSRDPDNLQLLVHYSRFYLAADGFRAVWEINPEPGSSSAAYRAIPIVLEASSPPLREVRLSRFGPPNASCIRVDRADGEPVFIDAQGDTQPFCP
jgi:hypothetical protein